jgi:hypothetical protein
VRYIDGSVLLAKRASRRDPFFEGGHQAAFDVRWYRFWLASLENFHGLFGGITNDPAIGALIHMTLQLGPYLRVECFVQEVV